MISSDGIIIRLPAEQVRECNRPSKGVILMKTKDGEKVATISLAQHEDVEEETEATEVSEAEVVTVEE
jgi:DNA gyrase subunit A